MKTELYRGNLGKSCRLDRPVSMQVTAVTLNNASEYWANGVTD